MLVVTTDRLETVAIAEYLGIVTGESVIGANIMRDIMANIRDVVGGRSTAYEASLAEARDTALEELRKRARDMGADAVVGATLDVESIGGGGMMMVSATGTAVRLAGTAAG